MNGVNSTYTYRPDGLRGTKTVNGTLTRHIWDGDEVSAELNADSSVKRTFTHGYAPATCYEGNDHYAFIRDRHGDVIKTVECFTESVIEEYTYDAYGNQRDLDSPFYTSDTNPYRYSGEYYDYETGFIYLRARYYDSTNGRFISEDPARDGANWYAYCAGNPVMFVDPSGLEYAHIMDFINGYRLVFDEEQTEQHGVESGKGFVAVTLGEYYRAFYYDGTIIDREYDVHGGLVYEKKFKVADNVDGKLYMHRSAFVAAMGMTEDGLATVKTSEDFYISSATAAIDFASNVNGYASESQNINDIASILNIPPAIGKSVANLVTVGNVYSFIKNQEYLSEGMYRCEVVTVQSPHRPESQHQVYTVYGIDNNTTYYQYVKKLAIYHGIPTKVLF